MLLYENKKAKLLNTLKVGINPFKKFVATGEIKEDLGLVPSRQSLIEEIRDSIKNNEKFILPIIGEIGTGKTHLYWALKYELMYHNTIYISLENIYRKFYYNLYSMYIDDMGVEPLRNLTNRLCNEWGALEKKFGFFHIIDIKKIRRNARKALSKEFEANYVLSDVINAITAHQLDPYKRLEAENWLLGELMDIQDLSRLGLMHDLRNKNNAFAMLKLLIENNVLGTVLFIDDFEEIISMVEEPEEEEDAIFDPSYLYGTETSPEMRAASKTFDRLIKLLDIKGMKIIITLKSHKKLEQIKKMFKEKDETLLDIILEPKILPNIKKEDIYPFYKKNMEYFLKSINYLKFLDEFPQTYFPLNEKILDRIFDCTNGNPREISKYLIKIFNEIIFSDEKLEEILKSYEDVR
ncbi:MAG: hypothetical protein ACTSR8_18275 [Promethearchaeota archaeon]